MNYGKLFTRSGSYQVISRNRSETTWYVHGEYDSEGDADLIVEALEARERSND